MKIKTLIVDDEPVALDILETYIRRLDMLQLEGRFASPSKAFQYLESQPIDLLFLDINMPNLNGIELLQSLSQAPQVIFTTAYDKYALLGYELDIVDYLLKPIAYPRFLKALNKIIPSQEKKEVQGLTKVREEPPFIFVSVDKKMKKIYLVDIVYLESIGNYVKIHTTQEVMVTHASLTYMEEKLPAEKFVRIHRSYMIALAHLSAYTATNLEINQQTLPISRNYKMQFFDKVKQ